MEQQIASGQITITDLNDGKSFILRITDSLSSAGYFSYNPDNNSYNPDLSSGISLTPTLYTTTSSNNLLTATENTAIDGIKVRNKKWLRAGSEIPNGSINGNSIITLNLSDIFPNDSINTVNYSFSCEISEELFNVWITMSTDFTFTRVRQGSGANYVILSASPADTFVNASFDETITIDAKVFQNGSLLENQINKAYHKWYYYDDTSVESNKFVEIKPEEGSDKVTWNSLKIMSGEVYGSEIYKYSCKFTDSSTPIESTIVIIDYSDPIHITVTSNSGDVFRPGMTNKTLVANVYKKEGDRHVLIPEAEASDLYSFKWNAYDKDGVAIPLNAGSDSSQKLEIEHQMVNIAATFIVSVTPSSNAQKLKQAFSEQYGIRKFLIK